jgi:hypothetical protein
MDLSKLNESKEITHMCALEVTHKKSGKKGHPIKHTLTESGKISHYTVEFEDVIVENISVRNLDILVQEEHSHKRDDKKNHDKNKKIVSEDELEEESKPDFPDVDGDGDRSEPISQAQKDKKAKGGNNKPKKKAKKGEIPPQLRNHVKGKKKNSEEKEELEEINMGVRGGLGKTPKSETDAAKKQSDKNQAYMKKQKDNKKSKLKEGESEDKKEKFKKGLKGELDDSADQKVDAKLKQKILDSLTVSQLKAALAKKEKKESKLRESIRRIIKRKLKEQQDTPDQQDTKLSATSGGRYSAKDPEMAQKVKQLAQGIIKNPSLVQSTNGVETIIQKMIAILGSSDKTLSQTKTDIASVKNKNK